MTRAVLDSNVVVSAAANPLRVPGRVVSLAGSAFELVWTPTIALECYRVVGYPRVRRLLRGRYAEAEATIAHLAAIAVMVDPDKLPPLRAVGADPDDDVLFATALAGRADFVVTGDAAVLAVHSTAGVLVVTPAEFLATLGEP